MDDRALDVTLPNGTILTGSSPIVVLGPNGSGKSRNVRELQVAVGQVEVISALRSTYLSFQLPFMSYADAESQISSSRVRAKSQQWEQVSDFDISLSKLLAEMLTSPVTSERSRRLASLSEMRTAFLSRLLGCGVTFFHSDRYRSVTSGQL